MAIVECKVIGGLVEVTGLQSISASAVLCVEKAQNNCTLCNYLRDYLRVWWSAAKERY